MAYDPNFPPDHQALKGAPFRAQFNALKAIIDAQQIQIIAQQEMLAGLQEQLAPLVPALSRASGGQWTLAYAGTQDYWQVWVRSSDNPAWSNFGEIRTSQFPASDDAMSPGGTWWQVKICGQDGDGNPCTPFSNIISFGPVP